MRKMLIFIVISLISFVNPSYSQFIIKGKVINEKKEPVANAKVEFINYKNKKIKTSTDKKGDFSIQTADSIGKLIIKSSSYKEHKITVTTFSNEYYLITLEKGIKYKNGHLGPRETFAFADGEAFEARAKPVSLKTMDGGEIQKAVEESFSDVSAGKLTAGDINDFKKWKMWNDIAENELYEYRKQWSFSPIDRYTLQLKNKTNIPIVGADVFLKSDNKIIWQSKTDNTGKAELWANPFNNFSTSNKLSIEVKYKGKTYTIDKPTTFYSGINYLEIDEKCDYKGNLDIAFVVDATGSMGDEIEYLKAELTDIIQRLKDTIPDLNIRLSASFYRDFGDEYLVKSVDFTQDVQKIVEFIKTNYADGGGDFPEAVDYALEAAINGLSWNENSITRIVFLILDAPPHNEPDVINRLQKYITLAAAKGIRIVPLTCSGIDKSTEYLMRSFALLTNGTYLFLTDDSGIGAKHLSPTTDNYSVQLLNSLILRTIYQFSYLPPCVAKSAVKGDTLIVADAKTENINNILPSDEQKMNNFQREIRWKYYPNPCRGVLYIEVFEDIKELFISDITGKIVFKIENSQNKVLTVDLSKFPNGYYFIRYEYAPDKWLNGKFILER